MDLDHLLIALVPRRWTARQAVQINELLWRLQVALWTVHGGPMDAELAKAEQQHEGPTERLPADEALPF